MNEIKIGKHLLETLTTALYADPIVVFREYVQNAIDSCIANIVNEFEIKININLDADFIRITDNGAGICREDFLRKMKYIAISQKSPNQIGFRGIGRLSGLSFCDKLIFTNKHAESNEEQTIIWENKKYQEILETEGEIDLIEVIEKITTTKSILAENTDHYFFVEMQGLSQELRNCILQERKKRGRQPKVRTGNTPSASFISKLCALLPLPYREDFSAANAIREEYYKVFNLPLSDYEFVVKLNNDTLYKEYKSEDIRDENLFFIPVSLDIGDGKRGTIGLIWLSFNYLFQAYDERKGISVRSKNMLLSGSPILADEAAKSINSVISHSDYVAAERDVIGEFLIKTDYLKDNSKRDWFRTDANTAQLREIIFEFMSNMQGYRRVASKYYNSSGDKKTEKLKSDVWVAFERFVTGGDIDKVTLALTRNTPSDTSSLNTENTGDSDTPETIIESSEIISDASELIGYSSGQKDFYVTIMNILFEYFSNNGRGKEYQDVKRFILERLNNPIDKE